VVDLKGMTVVPGFGDNHDHVFDSAAIMQRGISLEGATTVPDVLSRIRQGMATAKPGETVFTTVMRSRPATPPRRNRIWTPFPRRFRSSSCAAAVATPP
jgi:predicted amidohydrolase YtcJ